MAGMFCYQCEQTSGGRACTGKAGVCGKRESTAVLQDGLTGALAALARAARKYPPTDDTCRVMLEGLFATVTNVDFDDAALEEKIGEVRRACAALSSAPEDCAAFDTAGIWRADEDIRSMKSLILFGIRGIAAYAYHARVLGYADGEVTLFFYKALAAVAEEKYGLCELLPVIMETGRINLKCMELLDKANTETYGAPKPAVVSLTIEKGPFVIVSGHDLHDLALLLEQSAGRGVNVYTHGEMLPAHAYPELKKHPHLKGHFGTAWQNQRRELEGVPAPALFTTNCLMPVPAGCRDRVFTTAEVRHPGLAHIGRAKDFSPVIGKALELGGYAESRPMTGINGGGEVRTGFAHGAVLSMADALVDAVKRGAIRHFFLVGGCDGAKPGRSYYTEFVEQAPKDTVILTLGCGKYRFNDMEIGEIDGIPRLMDMGQCNDAYSAVKVALALSDAFGCGVNDLPLTLVLSWYEQKAVGILLSLLYLGFGNIFLGPALPAFVSPHVLKYLAENFAVAPIGTPQQDLEKILGRPPRWTVSSRDI
jgi:hydroxylamine reductase